jgi:hypothetical protein
MIHIKNLRIKNVMYKKMLRMNFEITNFVTYKLLYIIIEIISIVTEPEHNGNSSGDVVLVASIK